MLTEPRFLLQVTSLRGPGRSGTGSLCCFHLLGEDCGAGEPKGKGSAPVVPAELAERAARPRTASLQGIPLRFQN